MDTIIRAGLLYVAEIWGWRRWEDAEKVQSKFVEMNKELKRNTPSYIWQIEAGSENVEIRARIRACKYLLERIKMGGG